MTIILRKSVDAFVLIYKQLANATRKAAKSAHTRTHDGMKFTKHADAAAYEVASAEHDVSCSGWLVCGSG